MKPRICKSESDLMQTCAQVQSLSHEAGASSPIPRHHSVHCYPRLPDKLGAELKQAAFVEPVGVDGWIIGSKLEVRNAFEEYRGISSAHGGVEIRFGEHEARLSSSNMSSDNLWFDGGGSSAFGADMQAKGRLDSMLASNAQSHRRFPKTAHHLGRRTDEEIFWIVICCFGEG